ncbi:Myb-related transcription factor, partner of profilin [Merluccius polli]|uniref:Myb-related transcription factor, partner of profilin n=1 Tax=Merluccius polli TaxID=89951 RepID=A0AA47MWA5_MERPO|nr:Myb-related transcription factor, partner of profilin [Merluccius polli]
MARKRREAFKAKEMHILLEGVEANKGLLFDRFRGAHTNKQKAKKWGEIAERMTAVTGIRRSELEVRKKWQDFVSLTKKKASDLRHRTTLTGAGANTAQPLNDDEEKAMAIIGFPGGTDVHAGIQNPSGEPRQEAEEPITAPPPTSSPIMTSRITAPPPTSAAATSSAVVSAAHTTPSTASAATASVAALNSCQCSQDLVVELEREKVGLLKDVCGLLREAADRDKAFQDEILVLKRAKLNIAARRLALEEEKLGQPQLSIRGDA